jgi:SAM-dependent methyltransferase
MPASILTSSLRQVRSHPWWHARAALAVQILHREGIRPPAAVCDAGCGWGVNLDRLEQAGYSVTGLDLSREILELIDSPRRALFEADLTKPFPSGLPGFDAFLALDVIEHVDDDAAVVSNLSTLLKPGGLAVVSVPALPELFSEYDSMQGHRRRYQPARLRQAFEGSSLQVKQVFFWGAWMVPLLRRMRSKKSTGRSYTDYLRLPPWPAPLLMQLAYKWEASRALDGKLKTGTSLFAVAVRRGNRQ